MTLAQQHAAPTEDAPKDGHILTGTLPQAQLARHAERGAAAPEPRALAPVR